MMNDQKLKPRMFGYNDQTGAWRDVTTVPLSKVMEQFRSFEIFYEAEAVERTLMHYEAFFSQVEKHVQSLPEAWQKFFFDMKRRIDNEAAKTNGRVLSFLAAPPQLPKGENDDRTKEEKPL